jgi:hypothetical protein
MPQDFREKRQAERGWADFLFRIREGPPRAVCPAVKCLSIPSSLDFGESPARLDGLPFFLDGRFLVRPAQLEFFEQTIFRQLILKNFQRFVDIVIKNLNLQKNTLPSLIIL